MSSPLYFDIHSHLNFPDYQSDWEIVLGRLRETKTYTICVGTDLESSKKAVELANKYEEIYACIGMHPVDDPSKKFQREDFEPLVKNKKVVAIGECGLDFFHQDKTQDKERQENDFRGQIDFALDCDLPIMIHSRNAYQDLLEILEPLSKVNGPPSTGSGQGKLRGNVHFFAGNIEEAKRFFDIGFTISFTGVITFARNYDEVIKYAPLEMIMSETDAPFVSPAPYRGKRNEPSYVSEVVKKIAEIRGEDEEKVAQTLVQNTKRVFNI